MKRLIPTRWSHLIGWSGVGALMRADDWLYVIKDIHHWTDDQGNPAGEPLFYVDLLRQTLRLDKELRQPPKSREIKPGVADGLCVPALPFPGWARCPRCGLLHWLPWRHQVDQTRKLRCTCERRGPLQQVGWIMAHPQGGLAEVPWHFLVHQGARTNCRADREQPSLYLRRDPSGGLGWKLHCKRCRAAAPFEPHTQLGGRDPQHQPWSQVGAKPVPDSPQPWQILEVNDSRIYFPWTKSGLVIPPESRVSRGGALDRLYCNRLDRAELERCRNAIIRNAKVIRQATLQRLANRYRCTPDEVEHAWREIDQGWPLYGETVTPGKLLEKEYSVLTEQIPDVTDGEEFVTCHRTADWRALALTLHLSSSEPLTGRPAQLVATIDRLVAVTRLREVRVFLGFTRVTKNFYDHMSPTAVAMHGDTEPSTRLVPPDLDGTANWLPAVELFGEGIFFTLDEALLKRWAAQPGLTQRARRLQARFERTGMRFPVDPPIPLTPRFLLLHTLAHLLIRRLEAEAGYPAASIRERIYCAEGPEPMAGILVYVAVPDIVGSLGGLAELAEPARFLRLMTSVFDHADWCSLDPVCAEHEGQGPSLLNLAACHACTLVPEPSCAFSNVLLDRTFVAGDLTGEIAPLLDFTVGDGCPPPCGQDPPHRIPSGTEPEGKPCQPPDLESAHHPSP